MHAHAWSSTSTDHPDNQRLAGAPSFCMASPTTCLINPRGCLARSASGGAYRASARERQKTWMALLDLWNLVEAFPIGPRCSQISTCTSFRSCVSCPVSVLTRRSTIHSRIIRFRVTVPQSECATKTISPPGSKMFQKLTTSFPPGRRVRLSRSLQFILQKLPHLLFLLFAPTSAACLILALQETRNSQPLRWTGSFFQLSVETGNQLLQMSLGLTSENPRVMNTMRSVACVAYIGLLS